MRAQQYEREYLQSYTMNVNNTLCKLNKSSLIPLIHRRRGHRPTQARHPPPKPAAATSCNTTLPFATALRVFLARRPLPLSTRLSDLRGAHVNIVRICWITTVRACFYDRPQPMSDEDTRTRLLSEKAIDIPHQLRLRVCIECRRLQNC